MTMTGWYIKTLVRLAFTSEWAFSDNPHSTAHFRTSQATPQITMGMGKWPYGYYKTGLRKGKRRMGIPGGVPEMIDESEDSSPWTTTASGHEKGAVHHDQEARPPGGGSFVEEEAANYKRQKVRAALVDSVTAPALDLPSLQRQSMFALAMLIAARPRPPNTFGQQPLLAPKPWFLDHDVWQFLHDASWQQI